MNEELTNMQESIVLRFFEALDILKSEKVVTPHRFFVENGINRRNMYQIKENPSRSFFRPAWLALLVRDYGISADWLLTGKTPIFAPKTANKPRETKVASANS